MQNVCAVGLSFCPSMDLFCLKKDPESISQWGWILRSSRIFTISTKHFTVHGPKMRIQYSNITVCTYLSPSAHSSQLWKKWRCHCNFKPDNSNKESLQLGFYNRLCQVQTKNAVAFLQYLLHTISLSSCCLAFGSGSSVNCVRNEREQMMYDRGAEWAMLGVQIAS